MPGQKYFRMNAAELMDTAFDVYKRGFWTLFAFSALFYWMTIVSGACIGLLLASFAAAGSFPLIYMPALIVLVIAWIFVPLVGYLLIAQQIFYGEKIRLGDIFARTILALPRVLSVFLALLLLFLPLAAFFTFLLSRFINTPAIPFFSDPSPYFHSSRPVAGIILILLIMGIIITVLATYLCLSIPAAVYERKTFFNAVSKSIQLLKGSFWSTMGIRLIWVIIISILYYSLLALLSIANGLLSVVTDVSQVGFGLLFNALRFIFPIFFQIAIAPFAGILTSIIYFNQRIIKEGLDIEIGIKKLRGASL